MRAKRRISIEGSFVNTRRSLFVPVLLVGEGTRGVEGSRVKQADAVVGFRGIRQSQEVREAANEIVVSVKTILALFTLHASGLLAPPPTPTPLTSFQPSTNPDPKTCSQTPSHPPTPPPPSTSSSGSSSSPPSHKHSHR